MSNDQIIVRSVEKGKAVHILCPIGHSIEYRYHAQDLGGSLQVQLSAYQRGEETRWHRLAAQCQGAGHETN